MTSCESFVFSHLHKQECKNWRGVLTLNGAWRSGSGTSPWSCWTLLLDRSVYVKPTWIFVARPQRFRAVWPLLLRTFRQQIVLSLSFALSWSFLLRNHIFLQVSDSTWKRVRHSLLNCSDRSVAELIHLFWAFCSDLQRSIYLSLTLHQTTCACTWLLDAWAEHSHIGRNSVLNLFGTAIVATLVKLDHRRLVSFELVAIFRHTHWLRLWWCQRGIRRLVKLLRDDLAHRSVSWEFWSNNWLRIIISVRIWR